jgi:glycosyltransferase involved in cell wall biosynthesis
VRHPLRPLFRVSGAWQLRRAVAGAQAVTYVTASALQKRYPPASGAFSTFFSDVQLPEEAYVTTEDVRQRFNPRLGSGNPRDQSFTLVTVGSLAQLYKAPDIQIRATSALVEQGWNVRLVMIGDGKHRADLERLATELGIGDHVSFRGQLTAGAPVRAQLDPADIFLLPSRAEGLPRALVEAMARGLPAIGSTVGGIPELLAAEDLVPPGDVAALAGRIEELLSSPQRRYQAALRNLETARGYHEAIMQERRRAFLRAVRDTTAQPAPRHHQVGPAATDTTGGPLQPPAGSAVPSPESRLGSATQPHL